MDKKVNAYKCNFMNTPQAKICQICGRQMIDDAQIYCV